MLQPKPSRAFTADCNIRSNKVLGAYVAPSQPAEQRAITLDSQSFGCVFFFPGFLFHLTTKQLKSHGTTYIKFPAGYTHSYESIPRPASEPAATDQGHLVKSHFPRPRPSPPTSVQAFCLLGWCFSSPRICTSSPP